jgi:hypothetical protein
MRLNQGIFSIAVFTLLLASLLSVSSCFSMKYSTTGASIPLEAKTVSVQFFENLTRSQEAGLNQQVTDKLKDFIQANSRLLIINGTGDMDFEGAITGYAVTPTAIVSGDEAAKNRFTITLKIKFTCEVKPELNFESSFSRYEDYDANTDFETAKSLYTDDLLALLVEDIFNKAFANW